MGVMLSMVLTSMAALDVLLFAISDEQIGDVQSKCYPAVEFQSTQILQIENN